MLAVTVTASTSKAVMGLAEVPRDPIQLQKRQQNYPWESGQPRLTYQCEDVSQAEQCKGKWINPGSVMKKNLQRINEFINASPHFNFCLDMRKKCGLELQLVE